MPKRDEDAVYNEMIRKVNEAIFAGISTPKSENTDKITQTQKKESLPTAPQQSASSQRSKPNRGTATPPPPRTAPGSGEGAAVAPKQTVQRKAAQGKPQQQSRPQQATPQQQSRPQQPRPQQAKPATPPAPRPVHSSGGEGAAARTVTPSAYLPPPRSYPNNRAMTVANPVRSSSQQTGVQHQRGRTQTDAANDWTINTHLESEKYTVLHPNAVQNNAAARQLAISRPAFKLIAVKPDAKELSFPGVENRINMDRVCEGETPTEILWLLGDEAKEKKGMTDTQTSRVGKQVPVAQLPGGLGVLTVDKRGMSEEQKNEHHRMEDRAALALQALFAQEDLNPSTGLTFMPLKRKGKNILGFNKSKGPAGYKGPNKYGRNFSPTIADIFSYLPADLAEYLMSYLKGLAEYIGCQYDCIPEWVLILLQYIFDGFPFHTDGVADFNHYAGIIANIAMGFFGNERLSHPKHFDLVKLIPDTEGPQAIRITHDQFDCTYMSGESRVLWGHGIPKCTYIQQTAGIKMPENIHDWKHKWIKEISFEFPKFPKPVVYIDTVVAIEEGKKSSTAHKAESRVIKSAAKRV